MALAEPVRLGMDDLLRMTVQRGASDLHLTVGLPPMLRINGKLAPTEFPRLSQDDTKRLLYGILNDKQREYLEKHWDLDCSHAVKGFGRFRVNIYKQRGAFGGAFRSIPNTILSRQDLGLPAIVDDIANRPHGLILVTGVTGSGKSTTLSCIIDQINGTKPCHIITIEDPIEYVHYHKKAMINQREVSQDTLTWSAALRAVLREDPNVIMVGEMRDPETISATITAAETGHLVLSTLHTVDCSQSVDRIIDVFPPHQQQQIRIQLAGVLEGILSQQLVPHASGVGRAPAVEALISTSAIRSLIREGKTHQIYSNIQTGGKYGMQTMDQALLELYKAKTISLEEVMARTIHPDEIKRLVDGSGK